MLSIYLAGPMTGYDNYNFEAFEAGEAFLTERLDALVVSPATFELDNGHAEWVDGDLVVKETFDYKDALARDFDLILNVDAIAFLPGWTQSTGAKSEFFVGYRTGKKMYTLIENPDADGEPYILLPLSQDEQDYLFHSFFSDGGDVPDEWQDGPDEFEIQLAEHQKWLDGPVTNNLGESLPGDGEVRVKNEQTGGEKGSKLARFDLLPYDAIWELAKHYGRGSQKYEDRNWERGYDWGLSFAAAQRHLAQFWAGEDIDPETGTPHVIAAAWHCLALYRFMVVFPDLDTRGETRKTLV